jgi:hypothetical protein
MPYPLINLPAETQTTLFLIREELKSRKLFDALHQAGLDDCYFQPHLDSLILKTMGIDHSDETFNLYNDIMEKRSVKISADRESIMKQVMKAYHELVSVKKQLSRKKELL